MSWITALPTRAARWSAAHPWRAIGAWFAFVALAVGMAVLVPAQSTTDADYRVGDSGRAHALLDRSGLLAPPGEAVLITARSGALDPAAATSAARQLTDRMTRTPGVAAVAPLVWNGDRTAALVTITLTDGAQDGTALTRITESVAAANPALEVREAGDLTIDEGINERVAADLHTAEVISLPVTLLLMLLVFGALVAAGVPVLLAGTSVAASMGLAAPISYLVPAEPTVNSMIVLIGMAVGVDYSLFYLKREREERAKGAGTIDAVEIAARTSGHAILVSGLAVIASLAGLFLAGGATFTSLATGAILVVGVAMIASITVLPALLVKLGHWVDRPRVPLLWRVTRRAGRRGTSARLLTPVVRYPRTALVIGLAAAIGLSLPAFGMRLHQPSLATLPQDIPVVATAGRIAAEFPSQGSQAVVVVEAPADDQPRVAQSLRALSAAAVATPAFVPDEGDTVTTSADKTVTRLTLAIRYAEQDPRTDDAIQRLRTSLAPNALDRLGAQYVIGGDAAWNLDVTQRQLDRLPWVISFVVALTLVMMGLAFRSIRLAMLSAGLNLLSVGVAFGVMRLVFQDGHFASALDFTSPGYLIDWVPLLVLAVLVGLSMDYHVFVVSRVREYAEQGLGARAAVRLGITDTAGVVTSAAAVMVSVFAIFAAMSLLEMKMMGVGLAVAILLDATLIRLVILPSALVLLGDGPWQRRTPPVTTAPASSTVLRPQSRRVVESSAAR